jgi:hypothetical protein
VWGPCGACVWDLIMREKAQSCTEIDAVISIYVDL